MDRKKIAIFCDDLAIRFQGFWFNIQALFCIHVLWTLTILVWIADQKVPVNTDASAASPSSFLFWTMAVIVYLFWLVLFKLFDLESDGFILAVWFIIGFTLFFCDPVVLYNDRKGLGAITDIFREYWGIALVLACFWWFIINWHTMHFLFQGERGKFIRRFWILFAVQLIMYAVVCKLHFVVGVPMVAIIPRHFFRNYLIGRHDGDKVLRGTVLVTYLEASRFYRKMLDRHPEATLKFGNLDIPLKEATKHFLLVGGSGSGKSLSLNLMIQDIVKVLNTGIGRLIIYDANHTTLQLLRALGIRCPVRDTNPFHQECAAWHISIDCVAPVDAEALTQTLIVEPMANDKGDSFWRDCAALLYRGVIEYFILTAPGQWDLRDICLAFYNDEMLAALLQSNPRTEHYLDKALENTDKTLSGIIQTIRAKTGQLQILAALWSKASSRISLKDFMTSNEVLILGRDDRASITMKALNNLLLSQFTQLLMNQESLARGGSAEYFLVIDELGNFRMNSLEQLVSEGRGRKVSLICTLQDIAQLRRTYGSHEAEIISGQFTHKALLRLTDPASQEWGSSLIGDTELRRTTGTFDWNSALFGFLGWGTRTGMAEAITNTRAVLASQFAEIQPVNSETGTGLTGYYITRTIHKHTYSCETLDKLLVQPEPKAIAKAPDEAQWLDPWTEEDFHRLNIFELICDLEAKKLSTKISHYTTAAKASESEIEPGYDSGIEGDDEEEGTLKAMESPTSSGGIGMPTATSSTPSIIRSKRTTKKPTRTSEKRGIKPPPKGHESLDR